MKLYFTKNINWLHVVLSSLILLLVIKSEWTNRNWKMNYEELRVNNSPYQNLLGISGNGSESGFKKLLRKVKILCWVNTVAELHLKRAVHVKNTWGKRCDKLIFMSSKNDDSLPSIDLGFGVDKKFLWLKTRKAFKYIYRNYFKDYGWFIRADDDSYYILENLRYFLVNYNPDGEPIYFGQRYKFSKASKDTYMSGGAGYVLNRSAVKLFVRNMSNAFMCPALVSNGDDEEFGRCLNNLGVKVGNSRDDENRERFLHFLPKEYIFPENLPPIHLERAYYPTPEGRNCCSDLAISFHHMEPQEMYQLDYLIYNLHPYGIKYYDPVPMSI